MKPPKFAKSALAIACLAPISGLWLGAGAASAIEPAPDVTPDWYSTMQHAVYAQGAGALTQTENSRWSEKDSTWTLSYWHPSGSGPAPGQPDADLTIIATGPDAASTTLYNSQFALDVSPLYDGFVLRDQQGVISPVKVDFDGQGDLTFTRPPMPSDCNAQDPQQYVFNMATRGKLRQYLVNVRVTFANREQQRAQRCNTAMAPVTETPAPANGSSGTGSQKFGGSPTFGSASAFQVPQARIDTPVTDFVQTVIFVGLLVGAGIAVTKFIRRKKSSTPLDLGVEGVPRFNARYEHTAGLKPEAWYDLLRRSREAD
jgi:hypothetical protein